MNPTQQQEAAARLSPVSAPASSRRGKVKLPPCGIFVGTGVYPTGADCLLSALYAHPGWGMQNFAPQEMIDKVIEGNQGNLIQFWGHARGSTPEVIAEWLYALDEIGVRVPPPDWKTGRNIRAEDSVELQRHADRRGAGALRFIKAAAARGLYTVLLYVDGERQWAERFKEAGEYYLGYDFGEKYTFSLDEAALEGKDLKDVTLKVLVDDLVERVREHVDERHAHGWGNVMATSSNFYIDYEIAAGTDVPCVEDFAFCHLNLASALSRGLYRQHDLPLWGSHLAHEHYSWLPYRNKRKFDLLKAAMVQKYMTGSKMIINESGGWFVEVTLCEDSPKFEFPPVNLPTSLKLWRDSTAGAPFIEEARKHYHKADYTAPRSRQYRQVISDFYDFVKANPAPEGQPESTVAIAKGNYDLSCHRFMPNYAIGGAYTLADGNPQWFEGVPERGWETVRKVFYPLRPVLGEHPNLFLSGSPWGMVDIVSFALDRISADFLSANYKALLFSGWNTASEEQYEILKKYVAAGGRLFISIPHLSRNIRRNYGSYDVNELVHGGDFSELCGVRVRGRGRRCYWATVPRGSTELGVTFPRSFGILATCWGDIEITDPAAVTLAVDDEQAEPLLLRRTYGRGEVYFLNSWAYPGALDADDGPGGTVGSPGLIGAIYRRIAKLSRGNVWITDDREDPGAECDYVTFSYFPEAGRICMQNADFERPHRFFLHRFGVTDEIELAPGEFRMLAERKHAVRAPAPDRLLGSAGLQDDPATRQPRRRI